MRATTWEFKNRAFLFGMVFCIGFTSYFLDQQNVTAAFANMMEHRLGANADLIARIGFGLATAILAFAAVLRTWASAYLYADIVYATNIKVGSLVVDGPYRFVRNPLYFANVLLAIGMGAMMSRLGFVLAIAAMVIYCYRLILREEAEFQGAHTAEYTAYLNAVPRLWPALKPRFPSSAQAPNWKAGFKAESWCWGFALALAVFAATLEQKWFYVVLAVSVALLAVLSAAIKTESHSPRSPAA